MIDTIYRKSDLVNRIWKEYKIPKEMAQNVTNAVLCSIMEIIMDGYPLHMAGFGSFDLVETKATKRYDMNIGKVVEAPPNVKIKFTPSSNLEKVIKERFYNKEQV